MNWVWFLIDVALLITAGLLGYYEGYRDGENDRDAIYKQGRNDELEWWIGIDHEAIEAREKMWKKGLRK